MSMPNIPDICPIINLCRSDIINMLMASIALEEIGISNIIEEEGNKVKSVIEKNKCNPCTQELLEINCSVEKVLDKIYKIENLLVEKLRIILEFN